jgi:hypothetical protein
MRNIYRLPPMFRRSEIAAGICLGLLICAAVFAIVKLAVMQFDRSGSVTRFADFGGESMAGDVRYLADWVADSRDAAGLDFVIVDKKYAKLYVFDSDARLRGSAPVLLGGARGDDSVPGIGSRPIAEVLPEERTTPAGRFVGERGHNARGEDVVWVDYDAGVSMHRVLTTDPMERRLERLATPTNEDNRISYGCINVPVAFYEAYVRPTFASRRAIIYVLPEIKPLEQVFGVSLAARPLRSSAPRSERLYNY